MQIRKNIKNLFLVLVFLICGMFSLVSVSYGAEATWSEPPADPPTPVTNPWGSRWLNVSVECLQTAGCSFDIANFLWFRPDSDTDATDRTSTLMFVQDVILAATMFIGTIVTIAFICAGVLFIIAGRKGDSGQQQKAVKGMISAGIGLVLVTCSYAIIRLIQYIAGT